MPEEVDRLKELARERWGETLRFADGDSQSVAFHLRGVVDTDEYDETRVEHER